MIQRRGNLRMKNPSVCRYVFTDPCLKAGAFMFLGTGIGTLITLSANNPDKFMEIVKHPLSDEIDFSIAATVGIAILGMIVLYSLINYIKDKFHKEEPIENFTYGRMYSAPVAIVPPKEPLLVKENNIVNSDLNIEHAQDDANFVLLEKNGHSPSSSDSDTIDPLPTEVRIPEEGEIAFVLR